jgi:hypothetical protein
LPVREQRERRHRPRNGQRRRGEHWRQFSCRRGRDAAATLGRHDPRSSHVFEEQVMALPQVIAAGNLAGEMDYLLTVVARDVAELQEVLARLAVKGGLRLVTHLKLAEVKPPSRLPLMPTTRSAGSQSRQRRRPAAR